MKIKTWVGDRSIVYKVYQFYFNKVAFAFALIPYPWVEKGFNFGGLSTFMYVGWLSPVTFGIRIFWFSIGIRFRYSTNYYNIPFVV